MKKLMFKYIFVLMVGLLVVLPTATAKEGGDQYGFGSENIMTGVLPGPGLYFLSYNVYYHGELKDGNGNNFNKLPGGVTPNVTFEASAIRFVEVTHHKVLGGDYAWHVIIPIVNLNVDVPDDNGILSHSRTTNFGDIDFSPLAVAWHHKNGIHYVAAVDTYFPSGYYSKNTESSIGSNYYSFEPLLCFTYLPKSKWELSTKQMYNIKTANKDTNTHSGQEYHMDYFAGKHLAEWVVGVSGYYMKQTTNDTTNGIVAPANAVESLGNRGQVFAFGPSVGYATKNHIHLAAHWQHETSVKNRFGGDKIWFRLTCVPSHLWLFSSPKKA